MSLRITPAATHPSHTSPENGAPSAPGVHDTLRARLNQLQPAALPTTTSPSATLQSSHPLESRLANWRNTQDELKMQLLRRQFGLAEPVRRQMELGIVRGGEWRPGCLNAARGGAGSVHEDILAGRDAEVAWEDVFGTREEVEERDLGVHAEIERRERMGW